MFRMLRIILVGAFLLVPLASAIAQGGRDYQIGVVELEDAYLLTIPYNPDGSERTFTSEFVEHFIGSAITHDPEVAIQMGVSHFGSEALGTFAGHLASGIFAFLTYIPTVGANLETSASLLNRDGEMVTSFSSGESVRIVCVMDTGDEPDEFGVTNATIQERRGIFSWRTVYEPSLMTDDEIDNHAHGGFRSSQIIAEAGIPAGYYVYSLLISKTNVSLNEGRYRICCGSGQPWTNFQVR